MDEKARLRTILGTELLAYKISLPAISLLALDPERGVLGSEIAYSERMLFYALLITTYPLLQIFIAPYVGAWLDARSKKGVVQWIHCANILGYGLISCAAYLKSGSLALLGLIIPSMMGSLSPVIKAMISHACEESEQMAEFSKIAMVKGATAFVGPFIGLWIMQTMEAKHFLPLYYSAPLILSMLFSVLGLLFTTFFLSKAAPEKIKTSLTFPWKTSIHLFKNAPYLTLVLFCFAVAYCTFLKFVPVVWIAQFGSGAFFISYFSAMVGLWNFFHQGLIYRYSTFLSKNTGFVFLNALLLSVSVLSLCFYPSWVTWELPLILFCFALLMISVETRITFTAAKTSLGAVQGVIFSIENSSYLIGPAIAARIAIIDPLYTFYWILSMLLIATAFFYRYHRDEVQLRDKVKELSA